MCATRPSIMSDGATMSAPACTCSIAACASSGSVASLSTSPSRCDDPAMPVRRVLAQADVGDHDELRPRVLQRPHRPLHDPLRVVRLRAVLVLRTPAARTAAPPESRATAARPPPAAAGRAKGGTAPASTRSPRAPPPRASRTAGTRSPPAKAASRAPAPAAPRCAAAAGSAGKRGGGFGWGWS